MPGFRLLQCAIPPLYHFITARALYYNARRRLGTARALCYNARYRLGTARALYYNARSASVPLGPSITMRGTASVPLGPSITMRGTASVPLGPSITMRGTASVPLAGPLLQCAVPPRYRFGTARALYYNARYRHPVWVLQSFNWIGVRNFQENTKTNGKPRNATLTL